MTGMYLRYKIIFIILAIIMLIAILWLVLSGQHINKIPSRGVFVFESFRYNSFFNTKSVI